ncbi:hypothetical protein BY996DRAFT_6951314 [Phakopsora pachyrhizi]|nr:hypothetical protein BY996DRAFT_6951314 [Phakopsora pachyrhizi]
MLNKYKMPSDLAEEAGNTEVSLLHSSIKQGVPTIIEIQKQVSKNSKPVDTVEPVNHKRKYHCISKVKSTNFIEQNTEDFNVLGPMGGSINKKLRLKKYLDGLIDTSSSGVEAPYEELKTRLAEPVGTYILLNSDEKIYAEEEKSTRDQQLNSLEPKAALESFRAEAKNPIKDNATKTKYLIEIRSKDPTTRLKALRNILFEQLKIQQYNELTSLDNFVADLYKKAKSESHPKYVLGSLVDWNVEKNIGQRVNYILKHDEDIKKFTKYRKAKNHEKHILNQIDLSVLVEAGRKIRTFWSLYSEAFRHNYMPSNKRMSQHDYEPFIQDIGTFSGENHLKNLNLDKNINEVFKNILLELNSKPGRKHKIKSLYQMAKNVTLMVLNYIIVFYRIFTPFDYKTIEEMQTNLVKAIENMEDFWLHFFTADCIVDESTDAHKKNPFFKDHIFSQLSIKNSSKSIHFKRNINFAARRFFWNWMTDFDGISTQFINYGSYKNLRANFLYFLEDCALIDFIESSPLPI